jgi:hypothetical protein
MAASPDPVPARAPAAAVDDFLKQARDVAPARAEDVAGRLVFALDATMSRQPTWDLACELQGQMFDAAGNAGALNVQLVYFRGFGECRASTFRQRYDLLEAIDDPHRLPRRPYADRQGSRPCAEGSGQRAGRRRSSISAMRWKSVRTIWRNSPANCRCSG